MAHITRRSAPRALARLAASASLAGSLVLGSAGFAAAALTAPAAAPTVGTAAGGCDLGTAAGNVQHVIEIQFDNVHFARTANAPNVPSDLEQMPHLLNFLESNGALLTDHHTPLIAHTATDILTTLTGVYGDRMGVPIANSFRYFTPTGSTSLGVSFAYWTDPIYDPTTSNATDTTYNMLTADGKNAPAPWVPFTRAGCNVGMVATANTILENIGTDIPTVFGASSPQAAEVAANPAQATADFVGIGVHCAKVSGLCSTANGGVADRLPDEPGGYSGYQALFGAKYVDPQVYAGGTPVDLNGQTISDGHGHVGFPGFDGMSAAVSLSYVAAMQEHGVPVTYAYISDAHDAHPNGPAYGPGEPGYVAALKSYDDAFAAFFQRLANDGITPANSLFIVTSDENDHFAGGQPSNPSCDGITTACVWSHVNCPTTATPVCPANNVGELNGNLRGLLATQQGITTAFTVHSDSAPNVYINGNPAPTSLTTRAFEQATAALNVTNLYSGRTEQLANYLADPVEEKLLHMVTADPNRTPTFTLFAKPDYYLYAGAPNCSSPCIEEEFGFAWNHGDVAPDINTTWLGLVGPGVRRLGQTAAIWSDHTDVRPTLMALTGLKDDYPTDGRVLWETMDTLALPPSLRGHVPTRDALGVVLKQLDAAVGDFGLASLVVSTRAAASNSPGDATYAALEAKLQALGQERDALVAKIQANLQAAEFGGRTLDQPAAMAEIGQGWSLIRAMEALAS